MGGKVVRAQRGERHAYQPVVSRLCNSSAPLDVVQALLELYPFTCLYIADLDAIQQRGQHKTAIAAIRNSYPELDIWLDAGIASIDEWQVWHALGVQCVIGSESQRDADSARQLATYIGTEHAVLSLDIGAEGPRGPDSLFTDMASWPAKVIGMTLARVGSQLGPDWAVLDQLQQHGRSVYAAGGVRHAADLQELKAMGIAGALIASALHDGQISAADLASL